MNRQTHTQPPSAGASAQDRFARRVTLRLDASAQALPHDIAERLRVARVRAAGAAAAAQRRTATLAAAQAAGTGTLTMGGPSALWWRLASVVPLLLLLVGLLLIDQHHLGEQITAAADIDAALLTDDLPPKAYSDPGFSAYLRSDGAE